jgi:[pyruvate, water dikinase]-phosphate phosphotransferase / [pyruvate, water dikinase] kinase
MSNRRRVFFISDRTGITVEMLGNSLLTQFEGIEFQRITLPFVDTREKIDQAVKQINLAGELDGKRPIVLSSMVDDAMSERLGSANALFLDFFHVFIAPLESELGFKSSHAAGRSHGVANSHEYLARIDAINYSLAHDDGQTTKDLINAQVILVGVSRSGKTPTALYLALQFGVRTANFPLTPDDFGDGKLPLSLQPFRKKLFGLTIEPDRLRRIRSERRPESTYASLSNCKYEIREAEAMMQRDGIPVVDTTSRSIEEIATTIVQHAKLKRHLF